MAKKPYAVLSKVALATLLASIGSNSAVFAKTDAILMKDTAGKYFQYDLEKLTTDAVNKVLGLPAPLYDEYVAKQLVAFHDDETGYVDEKVVNDAAVEAVLAGTEFALDAYTEAATDDSIVTPDSPIQVRELGTNGTVLDGEVINETVDTEALTDAITAANDKSAAAVVGTAVGNYAQADVDTYETAIASAQEVLDNADATQAEVNAAVTTLATATTTFEASVIKVAAVDTKALTDAITDANTKATAAVAGTVVGNYAQADIDTYKAAIAAAQVVATNTAATQAQVDAAVTTLATATTTFEAKAVALDTKALTDAITAANTKATAAVAGTVVGNYAQADIDTYKAAIAAAQVVATNTASTQAQVDVAVTTLATATTTFDASVVKGLSVDSARVNGLNAVTVNFNKAVDPATITSSNVKVYNSGSVITSSTSAETVDGSATASSVTSGQVGYILSSDKKALTIVFANDNLMEQSSNLKVTIDGVATTNAAEKISGYSYTNVVTDTTMPTATAVNLKNAKSFDVVFSEPVDLSVALAQVSSNIKIDGVAAIATVTPDYTANKLKVTLPTALTVGSHTITVSGIPDFAKFKTADATFSVNVDTDTTAPSIVSAKVVNQNTIDVTFSEDVPTLGTFRVNNGTALSSGNVALVPNTTNQVRLTGLSLNLTAAVETSIKYQGQADAVGNAISTEQEFKFATADDQTAPTVTAQLLTDTGRKNNITLTFSKSMDATLGTITVLDSKGNAVTTVSPSYVFKTNTNNTVLELTATQLGLNNVNAGTYTIDVKNMKDNTIRQNALVETKLAVNAIDVKAPSVVNSVYVVTPGTDATTDKVTFFFDEAMDSSTLNNLSNYIYGTTPLSAYSATISSVAYSAKISSVSADNKSVTLVVPNASSASTTFSLYALKDLAGNAITASGLLKANASQVALNVVSAKAIDAKTVKVVLDSPVVSLDPSSFKLITGSPAVDAFTFANAQLDTTDTTNKTVLLTVNGTLKANAGIYSLAITTNASLTKNVYGTALSTGTVGVTDAVAPSLNAVSIKVADTGLDATDYRTVTLSADGLTGTVDLSNITSKVQYGKAAATEDSNLALVLPVVTPSTQTLTSDTATLNMAILLGDNGSDGVSLSTLQTLAKADGDGNNNTLTLTGTLTDLASNSSVVKLVITVK